MAAQANTATGGCLWGLRSFAPPGRREEREAARASQGGLTRNHATHTALHLPLFACETSFAKKQRREQTILHRAPQTPHSADSNENEVNRVSLSAIRKKVQNKERLRNLS